MNSLAPRGLLAWHAILCTTLLTAAAALAQAQQDARVRAPPEFDVLAARYRRILQDRPRHGTAFDSWYRLYLDAGKLDELVASVEDEAGREPNDYAAQMLLGLICERRGRFDAALRAYSAAARLAPQDYSPHAARGSLLAGRYQFDEAAAALERALALHPPRAELLELHNQLGRAYLRQENTQRALATWSRLAEQFPEDPRVLQELAEVLTEHDQLDEAARRWRQLAALPGVDRFQQVHASIEAGSLDARRGKTQAAVRQFDAILDELDPDAWLAQDVRKRIGAIYERRDDLPGLVAFWEQRLARRQDELASVIELTRALSRCGRIDESIGRFRSAIELAPSRRDIREALIQELVRAGRVAEATRDCEELVELVPDDPDLLLLLGRLYLDAAPADKRHEAEQKAAETWRRIAAIRPSDPSLAVQVAEACRRAALGPGAAGPLSAHSRGTDTIAADSPLLQMAEHYYGEAVRRAPTASEYREYLGEFLHALGRSEEAVAAWSQIAAGPEATFGNWRRLTQVYAGFGYVDEAVAAGRRTLELRPDHVAALEQQVRLLMRRERFDDALADLSRLDRLAEEPRLQEDALHLRVDVLAAARRIDREIERLRRPQSAEAASMRDHWLLGLLLARQRRYAEAVGCLERAIALAPEDLRLARAAASLHEQSGDLAAALDHYRRLAQGDAKNRASHYEQIARIELALGRGEQAQAAADALVRLAPSSLAGYRLHAAVAFQLEKPDEGLDALRRAVRVAPRDIDARLELAGQLGRFERVDEAMDHYWRAFELADSPNAKLSVVTAMAALARASNRFERLLDDLRRLRRRHDDPKVLTLCLVEALRRGEDYEAARRELATLLHAAAPDSAVLTQLVALSEAMHDWQAAVEYQEQIVALAPQRRGLRSLARLYGELGDADAASQVWQRMLEELDDPAALLDVVDHHLGTGDFEQAMAVTQMGLAERPMDWRLLLRAAYAQMALDDSAAAAASMQSVLALRDRAALSFPSPATFGGRFTPAASPPTLNQPVMPELREIQAAQQAYRRFQSLPKLASQVLQFQQQHEAVRAMERRVQALRKQGNGGDQGAAAQLQREERRLAQMKTMMARFGGLMRSYAGAFPADLETAKIEAAVGLFLLGRRRQSAADWFQVESDRARDDPQRLRNLALVRAATGDDASWEQTRALFAELLPDDALVHVVELSVPIGNARAGRLSRAESRRRFDAVRASYDWLRARRPAHRADLEQRYLQLALALGRIDALEEFFDKRLPSLARFDDLARLIPYAQAVQDRDIQRRFFVRIAERAADPDLQANPGRLAAAMQVMLLGISGRSFNASNDEDVRTVLAVFDACMKLSVAVPASGSLTARSRSLSTTPPVQSIQAVQLRRNNPTSLQVVLSTQRAGRVLIEQHFEQFPAPTPHLNAAVFGTLQALFGWLRQADREGLLAERLAQQAAHVNGEKAFAYRTALVFVRWWSGRRSQALEALRQACEAAPNDAALHLTLASALHASDEHVAALAVLNRIAPLAAPLADPAAALRAGIFNALHAAGGEPLLKGLLSELSRPSEEPDIAAFFGPAFESPPAGARATAVRRVPRRTSRTPVGWSPAALSEARLAGAIDEARGHGRLDALRELAAGRWRSYPGNRQLAALVTLTAVAQGRTAEATNAAAQWAALLDADLEGVRDPSTWQVVYACLRFAPTRPLAFRVAGQLDQVARLRDRRDLRLALVLEQSRAHLEDGDLDAALRLVESLPAVLASGESSRSRVAALGTPRLEAVVEVLQRLHPVLLAAAMRSFTTVLVEECSRGGDTTPLVWAMSKIAARIPPDDKAAVLDEFLEIVFPDGPRQLPVLLPREGAGAGANLGQALVVLARDAGRLPQLRERLDEHPQADAPPVLALRAEAAAAAGDDDATDRLLAQIAARGDAPLWSPRCLLPGFGTGLQAEFRHDFRAAPIDEAKLQLGSFPVPLDRRRVRAQRDVAAYFQRDEQGLRITLPARAGNLGHVGAATRFSAHGDFEITASFEFLAMQPPQRGAKVTLYVGSSERAGVASLGTAYRGEAGRHFAAYRTKSPLGRNSVAWNFPTDVTSGRLRLIRKGSTLFYLVAAAGSDDFRILHSTDWTPDDLRWIRAVVDYRTTTQSACDVRWLDLIIRAASLPGI